MLVSDHERWIIMVDFKSWSVISTVGGDKPWYRLPDDWKERRWNSTFTISAAHGHELVTPPDVLDVVRTVDFLGWSCWRHETGNQLVSTIVARGTPTVNWHLQQGAEDELKCLSDDASDYFSNLCNFLLALLAWLLRLDNGSGTRVWLSGRTVFFVQFIHIVEFIWNFASGVLPRVHVYLRMY